MFFWVEFVCDILQKLPLVRGQVTFSLKLCKHGDRSILLDRRLHGRCLLVTLLRSPEVIKLVALEVRYKRTLVLLEYELGNEEPQALKVQQLDDVNLVS